MAENKQYTVSLHCGKGSLGHNRRAYTDETRPANIDKNRAKLNKTIVSMTERQIEEWVTWKFNPYVEEFNSRQREESRKYHIYPITVKDDNVVEFDKKQAPYRKDSKRKPSYYETILMQDANPNSNTQLFQEMILQVGDKDNQPKKADFCKMVVKFAQYINDNFKDNMRLIGCYIHDDETGGIHAHLDWIGMHSSDRGMHYQIGSSGAICEIMGMSNTRSNQRAAAQGWCQMMRDKWVSIVESYGYSVKPVSEQKREHYQKTSEYVNWKKKEQTNQEQQKVLETTLKEIDKAQTELEDLRNSVAEQQNTVSQELSALEEKKASLEADVEKLRADKQEERAIVDALKVEKIKTQAMVKDTKALEQKQTELEQNIVLLNKSYSRQSAINTDLVNRNTKLKEDLNNTEAKFKSVKEELEKAEDEKAKLNSDLAYVNAKLDSAQVQLERIFTDTETSALYKVLGVGNEIVNLVEEVCAIAPLLDKVLDREDWKKLPNIAEILDYNEEHYQPPLVKNLYELKDDILSLPYMTKEGRAEIQKHLRAKKNQKIYPPKIKGKDTDDYER